MDWFNKELFTDVFSGFVGATACVYTGQPFDTVKVRLQVLPGEFVNPFACVKKTVVEEGVQALWKGATPALMGAVSENCLAFGLKGVFDRILPESEEVLTPGFVGGAPLSAVTGNSAFPNPFSTPSPTQRNYLIGAMTGVCTAWVLCPCDIIKARTQVLHMSAAAQEAAHVHPGTLSVIKDICKGPEGILRGFYRGIGVQIARDIPFYMVFFGTYDYLSDYLQQTTNMHKNTCYAVAGGISGQCAWTASLPMDRVKAILQTSDDRTLRAMDVARNVIKAEGLMGLYRGWLVTVFRAFPANAALFMGYETTKRILEGALGE